MKFILILVSITGLVLTILPSILVFTQTISVEANNQLMILGMFLWFFTAPYWVKEQEL